MEQRRGFLADEIDAAAVVDVFDVVPGYALSPVLLLQGKNTEEGRLIHQTKPPKKTHLH